MTVVINGTTGITSVNGTAAAPSVTGTDTDTGIVYGTNTMSLATGGTTAVTVDSSQNVGIGTATLTNKLNVAGAMQSSAVLTAVEANTVAMSQESGFGRLAAFGPNSSTPGVLDLYVISSNGSVQKGARIDASGNFKFDSGYGSPATAYGCRAWVNFNGSTGTIAGSGGISSVTKNSTGTYTPNFSFTMPDTNYCPTQMITGAGGINNGAYINALNTTSMQLALAKPGTSTNDQNGPVCVAILR